MQLNGCQLPLKPKEQEEEEEEEGKPKIYNMNSVKVFLLLSTILPSQSERCHLYYIYGVKSKPGDIYEFYNSVDSCQSGRLFRKSDEDLHYKQQWLQINIKTLMERERNENSTRDTDLHVLQWRHGCVVERHSNGSVMFLQGTDEYTYDGETLTFDLSVHWNPLVLDHGIIWDRESVSSLERRCVETLTRYTEIAYRKIRYYLSTSLWLSEPVIGFLCFLFVFLIFTFFQLIKYAKRDTQKTPSLVQLSDLHKTPMEPELEEIREPESLKGPERCEAALHTDSEEEDPADPSVEEGHTEDLHDTQSLCETEATAAARGAMGPKNISLPNVAMEREDADQNITTHDALLLPLPRRCRSKDISLPNLV